MLIVLSLYSFNGLLCLLLCDTIVFGVADLFVLFVTLVAVRLLLLTAYLFLFGCALFCGLVVMFGVFVMCLFVVCLFGLFVMLMIGFPCVLGF